jgi:hypothetical protein
VLSYSRLKTQDEAQAAQDHPQAATSLWPRTSKSEGSAPAFRHIFLGPLTLGTVDASLSTMDAKKTSKGRRPKKGAQDKVVVRTARTGTATVAVHANVGSTHVALIGDLRVMIVRDDDSWFARGLEIDFAEQGTSLEDVQARFEKSLTETIQEHLNIRGNIRELLRFAPSEVLQEYYDAAAGEKFQMQCVAATRLLPARSKQRVGQHQKPALPFFDKINYLSPVEAQR